MTTPSSGNEERTLVRSGWLARVTSPGAAALLLAVFYVFLLAGVSQKSATMDEFRHVTAGYSYWKYHDYRLDPENGNWPKRWTALALLGGTNPFPALESEAWRHGSSSEIADAWFNRTGDRGAAMLARGRAASGLLAVALGGIVWWWARRLFGPGGGMLALLYYVSSPIVLANGALMTSDLPAACCFLTALWGFDAMLRRLTPGRIVLSAVALAALMLAKMSGPILVPILLAWATIRLVSRTPLETGSGKALVTVRAKFLGLTLAALAHVVVIWGLIWASHGFRYSAFAARPERPGTFSEPWEWVLGQPKVTVMLERIGVSPGKIQEAAEFLAKRGSADLAWSNAVVDALPELVKAGVLLPAQMEALDKMRAADPESPTLRVISVLRRHRLLPEAYLYGYANVVTMAGARGSFFNGRTSITGFRAFFPYVFAVKTPLATLALIGLAGAAFVLGPRFFRRQGWSENELAGLTGGATFPLWALVVVYGVIAIASPVNIGQRHLLPIYPALYVLSGAVVFWGRWRPRTTARLAAAPWLSGWWPVGGLTVIVVIESVAWFPNYLAYFNGLVRPSQAYRHLVDSSLDWGQDLPAAKRYIATHPATPPCFLVYFGVDSPRRHGIRARQVYGYPNVEGDQDPLFKLLEGIPPEQRTAPLRKFFSENPDYDPNFLARLETPPSFVALKRASALRLEAGTYLVSASLVQTVFYHHAYKPWDDEMEKLYQALKKDVQPLFMEDAKARAATIAGQRIEVWRDLFASFQEFRFARLAAYLRRREPDDTINYSILVYRLSQAEIDAAENGAAPFEMKTQVK